MTFHIEDDYRFTINFKGFFFFVFQNPSRIYRIKYFASVIIKCSDGKNLKSDVYMILYFSNNFFLIWENMI